MAKAKKKTVFTVLSRSYDYNDEYYYEPEQGGGNAVVAYTTKAKAKAAVEKLAEHDYAHNNFYDYYNCDEEFSPRVCAALVALDGELEGVKDYDTLFDAWDELSEADQVRAWKAIDCESNTFFFVQEVELE